MKKYQLSEAKKQSTALAGAASWIRLLVTSRALHFEWDALKVRWLLQGIHAYLRGGALPADWGRGSNWPTPASRRRPRAAPKRWVTMAISEDGSCQSADVGHRLPYWSATTTTSSDTANERKVLVEAEGQSEGSRLNHGSTPHVP